MDILAFVKKDVGKLVSFATNPKTVSTTVTALGLASFLLGGLKDKNDRNAIKSDIMNEMGDELMEQAMAKAMKKLSESNKGS